MKKQFFIFINLFITLNINCASHNEKSKKDLEVNSTFHKIHTDTLFKDEFFKNFLPKDILSLINSYCFPSWQKYTEINVGDNVAEMCFQGDNLLCIFNPNDIFRNLSTNPIILNTINKTRKQLFQTNNPYVFLVQDCAVSNDLFAFSVLSKKNLNHIRLFKSLNENLDNFVSYINYPRSIRKKIALSCDNNFLAISYEDIASDSYPFFTLEILYQSNEKLEYESKSVTELDEFISILKFSNDGKTLITGDLKGRLKFYELSGLMNENNLKYRYKENESILKKYCHNEIVLENFKDENLHAILLMQDNGAYIFGTKQYKISIWNQNGKKIQEIELDKNISTLAVSDNGSILAIATDDGKIELYRMI